MPRGKIIKQLRYRLLLPSSPTHLKLQVVIFQLVLIYLLGLHLLVRGVRAVLSQLGGNLLQLGLVRLQLFLLQEIGSRLMSRNKSIKKSLLMNDFNSLKPPREPWLQHLTTSLKSVSGSHVPLAKWQLRPASLPRPHHKTKCFQSLYQVRLSQS